MNVSLALPAARPGPWRYSFLVKLLALVALVALADRLFYLATGVGATLGLFAAALLLSIVALRPDIRRNRAACVAIIAAAFFAAALIHDPGPLALLLCWLALNLAVLLPRTAGFGSGARWAFRLLIHSAGTAVRPLADLHRLARTRPRLRRALDLSAVAISLVLPVAGTILFLGLFATANPLIDDALSGFDPLAPLRGLSPLRLILWLFVGGLVWRLLRPRLRLLNPIAPSGEAIDLPGVSIASVIVSLVAFNALFLLQNLLDLAFLWSGAALPDGMSHAEYAHRGAYPLIATALLAGGFVLLTTRTGTPMAGSRLIRRLVTLWIAQNMFLVASTMLRTFNYIEAFSLTELRIQALVWMALVATGLALICIRLWLGRSSTWLVNANLLAVTLVLGASVWVDYDRLAAGWNVRHAREAGGPGTWLDLCHLNDMGDSALLPLIEFEQRPLRPELRDRIAFIRSRILVNLERSQADWRTWTWQGARRLAAAQTRVAAARLPLIPDDEPRGCAGGRLRDVDTAALTAPAAR